MNCEHPIRIKNQYTEKWMYVPCRHCDACRISAANRKSIELKECMTNYKYAYFLTLTYSPENVPYVIAGFSYIMRGFDYEVIEDLDEPIPHDVYTPFLQNHPFPAIGVIYYRDFQLFHKRFRKYIFTHYGDRKYKHFTVCEYGSRYGRPHAHIVILSNELTYEQVFLSARQSWKLHDWNRFYEVRTCGEGKIEWVNKACKVADKNVTSYIASYVSCLSSDIGISQYGNFQQKTFRSKNMGFGQSKQLLERYQDDVRRIAREDVRSDVTQDRKPFFYFDLTKIGSPSLCLISKRYIDASFAKPAHFYAFSFSDFISRAKYIIEYVEGCRAKKISLIYAVEQGKLKAQDLQFYRRWVNHDKVLCDRYDLDDYLFLAWKVWKYYDNCLMYTQMIKFEEYQNKDDYYLEQIDSYCYDLDKKKRRLFVKCQNKNYKQYFKNINLECPPASARNIRAYVAKYKSRLLPKHLNDVNKVMVYY